MKTRVTAFIASIAVIFSFTGCLNVSGSTSSVTASLPSEAEKIVGTEEAIAKQTEKETSVSKSSEKKKDASSKEESKSKTAEPDPQDYVFDLDFDFPDYSGEPYTIINDNLPFFELDNLPSSSFEYYSPLDALGRCQTCVANVGTDTMPTEERGKIGSVKPTGWHSVKYDNVDGKYLYNRCHLIGYQLTAENTNESNLITGTRYLNMEGMLPFENMTADYVKETDNHVLYRVTPIFEGDDLLAKGVLMEGYSVEDNGEGVCFNVFCYNVQPDIEITYSNGDSRSLVSKSAVTVPETTKPTGDGSSLAQSITYVVNTNTHKFHTENCKAVKQMSDENKEVYNGDRQYLIDEGYEPCGICNP